MNRKFIRPAFVSAKTGWTGRAGRCAVILAAAALVSIANSTAGGPLPDLPSLERSPGFAQAGGVLNPAKGETPAFTGIQHRPIKPHRDERGHAIRNVKNSLVTQNWSGYAVANFQTALSYSSASATWQVPKPTWGSTSGNPTGYEYNSIWVGIGGFCENASCSTIDQALIQLGTEQIVSQSGAVSNYVWYELYPDVSHAIPEPVQYGDIITASLECTANCVPNQAQTWRLSMTDQTLGWTWAQNFTFTTTMLSAEWIVEAPWYNGILPLNDYAQANFSPVVANGNNPNLSLTTNSIVLDQDPYGQTSNPSDVVNGDWFGGCWGYGSLTPCTAASFTGGTAASSTGGTSTTSTAPTASLSATPGSISSGGSSTLTWDSSNVTSCAGSGFTATSTSGAAAVYPTTTTTYGLTCSGSSGSVSVSTTVKVGTTKACHGKKC